MSVRSFVISGWGGKLPSFGMGILSQQLEAFGPSSFHSWEEADSITHQINATSGKIAVIGYSEGGMVMGWFEDANAYVPGRPVLTRDIELGIAYDPRGDIKNPEPLETITKYRRMIVYRSTAWWPHPQINYHGPTVKVIETDVPHPFIQFSYYLHGLTMKSIAALAVAP